MFIFKWILNASTNSGTQLITTREGELILLNVIPAYGIYWVTLIAGEGNGIVSM